MGFLANLFMLVALPLHGVLSHQAAARPACTNPCTCADKSGTYTAPHPDGCSQFYQCRGRDPVTGAHDYSVRQCGPGTLYNVNSRNCGYPSHFSCPAWGNCTAGRHDKFKHSCCGQYWECNNGHVTEHSCPHGQVFNDVTDTCRATSDFTCLLQSRFCTAKTVVGALCTKEPSRRWRHQCCGKYYACDGGRQKEVSCLKSQVFTNGACTATAGAARCHTNAACVPSQGCDNFRPHDTDVCKYIQVDPNSSREHTMACSSGLGWDQTKCTCTGNSQCIRTTPPRATHPPSTDCTAQLHLSFSNANSPMWIYVNPNMVTASNGHAVFAGREGVDADVIFVPYYANRAFPRRWAMRIVFRFNNDAQEDKYILVANDRCSQCVATIQVYAERDANVNRNDWRFTFTVTDTHGSVAAISARSTITDNSAWSEIVVRADAGTIRGAVRTPGRRPVAMAGNAAYSGEVRKTECGLSIGQGRKDAPPAAQTVALDGDVNDFKYYECNNLTDLL